MAQLGTDLVELVIQSGITPKGHRNRLACKAVQKDAVLLGLTQTPLVGLTMHGNEQLANLSQHADRRGPSSDMGPRAALCRKCSGQDHAFFGIAAASGSLGQFIFAPLGQALISAYGWQQAMIILAASTLLLIVPALPPLVPNSTGSRPAAAAASAGESSLTEAVVVTGGDSKLAIRSRSTATK